MPTATAAPYLLTLARGVPKLHRATCKKALANPGHEATTSFEAGEAATCCKPRPIDAAVDQAQPKAKAKRPPRQVNAPEPVPAFDPHPGERQRLALAEGKAKRAAKRDGLPIPPTPNLDKVSEEYAAGIDAKRREQLVADYEAQHGGPAGKRPQRVRADVLVRFHHGNKPMPDSQNKLSSLAYYYTKDVDGPGSARCSTDRLRDLLAAEGITEPEAEPWGPVTLPNGIEVKATAL